MDFGCVIFLNYLEVYIELGHTILSMVVSVEFNFNGMAHAGHFNVLFCVAHDVRVHTSQTHGALFRSEDLHPLLRLRARERASWLANLSIYKSKLCIYTLPHEVELSMWDFLNPLCIFEY